MISGKRRQVVGEMGGQDKNSSICVRYTGVVVGQRKPSCPWQCLALKDVPEQLAHQSLCPCFA